MAQNTELPSWHRVLECGLSAGTGLQWTVSGGVPASSLIVNPVNARTNPSG